jgi:hypothetical protein
VDFAHCNILAQLVWCSLTDITEQEEVGDTAYTSAVVLGLQGSHQWHELQTVTLAELLILALEVLGVSTFLEGQTLKIKVFVCAVEQRLGLGITWAGLSAHHTATFLIDLVDLISHSSLATALFGKVIADLLGKNHECGACGEEDAERDQAKVAVLQEKRVTWTNN